jgi:hypothetical protein
MLDNKIYLNSITKTFISIKNKKQDGKCSTNGENYDHET